MLFNSINFAIFLPIVFILYWSVTKNSLKLQNVLLLAASYFFYACWDNRFLFLLVFSTLLDYFTALKLDNAESTRTKKIWLWLSISINLGFLAVFKYYNFFISSFAEALSLIGVDASFQTLKIVLPVGISFYTFHGLSYIIDVYKSRIKPEKDFIPYAVFVSFFPLLVAGPIERATHLLPQILKRRDFDYSKAIDGLRQILWGLFKKIVIADNCAEYANIIFNDYEVYSGSTLFLGALFFAIQIYCDFSGYSDIALGTARLFGIELLRNFSFPYFSRNIAEFWRRWHISLSSWFRDYLYIPLGGSMGGIWMKVRNTFIIFIVSGFWHGANWTFIFWGVLNAIYITPSVILNTNRNNLDVVAKGKYFPTIKELVLMSTTFILTVFAWIFFRSNTVNDAINYISKIFSYSLVSVPIYPGKRKLLNGALICIFFIVEWFGREQKYALENIGAVYKPIRWLIYYTILVVILYLGGAQQQFIYFQF